MSAPLLAVSKLVAGYGQLHIVNGITLSVSQGEIVTIIGPNGAGKSTFLKALFGLVKIFGGAIDFQGQAIQGERPEKLVPRGLGFVPQSRNVFPTLTVAENLEMGAFTRKADCLECYQEIYQVFPGLMANLEKKAGALSGGQQKMLAIGMALMIKPRLLLLDEPSAGLAPNLVAELFQKIQLIRQKGMTILMVEQNASQALKISDRGYVFVTGRNKHTDSGPALLSDPQVGQLYLGH